MLHDAEVITGFYGRRAQLARVQLVVDSHGMFPVHGSTNKCDKCALSFLRKMLLTMKPHLNS